MKRRLLRINCPNSSKPEPQSRIFLFFRFRSIRFSSTSRKDQIEILCKTVESRSNKSQKKNIWFRVEKLFFLRFWITFFLATGKRMKFELGETATSSKYSSRTESRLKIFSDRRVWQLKSQIDLSLSKNVKSLSEIQLPFHLKRKKRIEREIVSSNNWRFGFFLFVNIVFCQGDSLVDFQCRSWKKDEKCPSFPKTFNRWKFDSLSIKKWLQWWWNK